jgi:hypothetical protein
MKAKNRTCRFLFLKRNKMNKGLLLADTCHCTFKGYSLEEVNLYLMTANELVLLEKKKEMNLSEIKEVFLCTSCSEKQKGNTKFYRSETL